MSTTATLDHRATEATAQAVADALASGRTWQAVATELCQSGWERQQAKDFVQQVEAQLQEWQHQQAELQPPVATALTTGPSNAAEEHGEVPGWIGYIGFLGLVNFLSWLFDWPFWVY